MTENEKRKKLELTPKQQKAFDRMSKALDDFRDAGGVLVGMNDYQIAINGLNIEDAYPVDSFPIKDDEVCLSSHPECLQIDCAYACTQVVAKLKNRLRKRPTTEKITEWAITRVPTRLVIKADG